MKSSNIMQDETFNRPDTPPTPLSFASAEESAGQLEPLAVPFGRLTSILRRHIRVVLLVFVCGVSLTAVVVHGMPRRYTAEASILVEPQRTQVSDLQAISADPGEIGTVVRTQIDILKSPTLATNVVKSLHLTDYEEFAPRSSSVVQKLYSILSKLGIDLNVSSREPTYEDTLDTAASILAGKITFANEVHSGVLRVAVTTEDPQLSAQIANELTREFLDFKRQAKFAAMQRAHDWFQEQMGTLASQLRDADQAVEQYRRDHRLDDASPSDSDGNVWSATANRQELEAVSRQLAEVSRDRARKEGQLVQAQLVLQGKAAANTLPEVLASPSVTQLLVQTAIVAAHEAQLTTAQGAGNPELVAVRAELQKLQGRTNSEMRNIASGLSAEVAAIKLQEQILRNRLEQLRSSVGVENSAQLGLRSLLMKARATRGIYESFLTRATQLANVAGIQEQDASLVSSARPPLGPSAPQSSRILALAAGISVALGVAIACIIERMRSSFSLPEQVEATLGLPLIGIVPRVSQRVLRLRHLNNKAAVSFDASLDKLRSRIRVFGDERPKVIMITSALPREGKSVLAANLARNAASVGWRVLLLECDFGCPSLARQFGLPPAAGLSDMLCNNGVSDSNLLVREPEPGLHLIVAGNGHGNPQELLASNRMSQLLAVFRTNYDLVILDTPPVLPAPDSQVLAKEVDATLMVVRWEKTARNATQDAVRLLRGSRARLIATVMTRVDPRAAAISGGRMFYAFSHYDGRYIARF